jgi:hypothetical protein
MFLSEKVPALFKQGKLKLVPTENGDSLRRVTEATLVIEPFPPALAHELGEDIAGHLFDEADKIRPELESIDLRVRCGLQTVEVAHHEELQAVARLTPVSVKDVSVTRIEDKKTGRAWLSMAFVLVFSLEEKSARNFVLDEFGRTLVWTFTAMQRELLNQAALHESIARLGEGEGSCTLSGDGLEPVTFNAETSKAHRDKAKQLRQAAKQAH